MTTLEIQAKVSTDVQHVGTGVDISGITGDWTLVLEVFGLDAAASASFVFEWSANSFTTYLTDIFPGPAAQMLGPIGNGGTSTSGPYSVTKRYTWTKKDFPNVGFGVTSTDLRCTLIAAPASGKYVTFAAWVDY